MSDDAGSSSQPSRSWRRERALRVTRQRLKRLEIETHRIKAELARLESENETDIADELTHELRLDKRPVVGDAQARVTFASASRDVLPRRRQVPQQPFAPLRAASANGKSNDGPLSPSLPRPPAQRRRKTSPAWLLSLGAHLAVLLLLAPLTYVVLTNDETPLFASMFDAETHFTEHGESPIELVSFEEFELPSDAVEEAMGLTENVGDSIAPVESPLDGEPARSLGQLNALPTDVGTLMSGGGRGDGSSLAAGGGRGTAGDEARLGTTNFFGTPARANRVVFLVDNSGSMKQGRMETTLFELARSVEAMGEKQEFYVVFYSDQAYPMLYPNGVMKPLAATRENKQRLYDWLQTIELCSGGALLKAMELAESLDPHVVYVLSDGDITSSRTMERLTQASDRKFPIHTLGMGVKKPQDAQNLAAIAQANHGTFQMVRPLPAAIQMAKARPIRSNPFGVAWGAGAR